MALVWAAGIIYFAMSVAGGPSDSTGTNADQPTDATGAPISPESAKKFEEIVNGL